VNNINNKKIEGLLAAPFSALDQKGNLHLDVIDNYSKFLIKNGVKGVFVNGTSGEGYSLTIEERIATAEKWVDVSPIDFKVIIHVGHTSIEAAKNMAAHAQEIGAFGFGSMAPIFFKPSSVEELFKYIAKEASAASNIPYYYYHIPQISGTNFPMVDLLRLVKDKIENFKGIKFSLPDLGDFKKCIEFNDGQYDILYCHDQTLLSALVVGARGSIGSTYNYAAPLTLKIMEEYFEGNIEESSSLAYKSLKMVEVLENTGSYFAGAKELMRIAGIELGTVRAPLNTIPKDKLALIVPELDKLGIVDHLSKK
jgi:N-acetylneuraminate lyase